MPSLPAPEARLAAAMGWSLLHSLWQGTLVGIALAAALRIMRKAQSRTRYALCCGALAALTLCPLLTFLRIAITAAHPTAPAFAGPPFVTAGNAALLHAGSPANAGLLSSIRAVEHWLPAILLVWILGAGLALARIVFGLIRSRTLRRVSPTPVTGPLSELTRELAGRLGIARSVDLLLSRHTGIPAVTGWRKPAILIPPSAMEILSLEEMETILAHELAHIRRHDYPMNVVQSAVEALLFYHPVVWWVSRQIRREREHCCDDIALHVSGCALVCAKALTALEERRSSAIPLLSPAASRGDLTMRIRRLLAPEPTTPLRRGVAISLASLGLCAAVLLAVLSLAAADAMSPLLAEAAAPNPPGASSKQTKSQPPDMACTYYKHILEPQEHVEPHPGACVDTGRDTGTFYCQQTDEDKHPQQEQSACQWKVQRLHQWQELQRAGQ
jgi:beta-lactamase regulating signal transducer with metallopeptidase domain